MTHGLRRGVQIAYVPQHAEGRIDHGDVEFGFIERAGTEGTWLCRYWRDGEPGRLPNAERTDEEDLRRHDSVPADVILRTLEEINATQTE